MPTELFAYDYWGSPQPFPETWDVTGARAYKYLQKAGNVKALQPLSGTIGTGDGVGPLILSYRLNFPDTQNALGAWAGDATYLRELIGAFGPNSKVLSHERNTANEVATYVSSWTLQDNQPHTIRAFAFKATDDNAYPVLSFAFGAWLFSITPDGPEIACRTNEWTQAAQDALYALMAGEGYDDQIDVGRAELYTICESLSGGENFKKGEFFEVTFIPEPLGALNVYLDGKHTRVLVPDIIDKRKAGVVTFASPLTVRANGGAFLWQTGYPLFASEGTLAEPFPFSEETEDLRDYVSGGNWDESLPGTNVTVGQSVNESQSTAQTEVKLETSNTRFTPFVYGAEATYLGGPRQSAVLGEAFWWSEYHRIGGTPRPFPNATQSEPGTGSSCIEDVTIEVDADMWRRVYKVSLIDMDGIASRGLSRNSEGLENRVCTLAINGATVLTKGLIRGSERLAQRGVLDKRNAEENARAESRIVLTCTDAWSILDEDLMRDSPIGDGKYLGAYVRLLLQNAGFSTSEIAGVSSTAGRKLPKAGLEEAPCVRPTIGQNRGDWLRQLIERYGMGLRLYQNALGVWQLAGVSNTVVAAFARGSAAGSGTCILSPLDFIRDYSESYNDFVVEGATDSRGKTLSARWIVQESLRYATVPDQRYMGRAKTYPTVKDDGLRTRDDVMWVLRSLVSYYGGAGRFVSFEGDYRTDVLPGVVITVDGIRCLVTRIGGGSVAGFKTMNYVAQELVQDTAPPPIEG